MNVEKEIKKIEKELDILKSKGRSEVAEMIKEARAYGDLRENAQYDDAKEHQRDLEIKIKDLEQRIIVLSGIKNNTNNEGISIGSTVSLLKDGKEMVVTILPPGNGNPQNDTISADSVIGNSILGKKVGESFSINLPTKTVTGKILSIS